MTLGLKKFIWLYLIIFVIVIGVFLSIALFKNDLFKLKSYSKITSLFFKPKTPHFSDLICNNCNVVLITLDSLRADHLSSYGYYRPTSPNIDRLSQKSLKFNNHYAQIPSTVESHWSLMTGLYLHTHRMPYTSALSGTKITSDNIVSIFQEKPNDKLTFNPKIKILPTVLKESGYSTAAFVSSDLLVSMRQFFDTFKITPPTGEVYTIDGDINWVGNQNKTAFYETMNNTLTWISNNSNKKFFVWLHEYDVHNPYDPIPQYDIFKPVDNYNINNKYAAKYDGEINFVDHKVGIILSKLNSLNLNKNTVVILTSDHGESFGENSCKDYFGDINKKCTGHVETVLESAIHIPLIISLPNNIKYEINSVTESIDIFPTIIEILGLNKQVDMEGKSMVLKIIGEEKINDFAFAENFLPSYNTFSVRQGDWKLILIDHLNRSGGKILRLHNIKKGEEVNYLNHGLYLDPKEKNDYYNLKNILEKLITGNENLRFKEENLDEDTLQLLQSMGYL